MTTPAYLPNLKQFVFNENIAKVAEFTARHIYLELANRANQDVILIGLSGSRALQEIYTALFTSLMASNPKILKKLQFFLVDERFLPEHKHGLSSDGLSLFSWEVVDPLIQPLIDQKLISENQYHRYGLVIPTEDNSASEEASAHYTSMLVRDFLTPPEDTASEKASDYYDSMLKKGDHFDIVILNGGIDGRCAGILPGHTTSIEDLPAGFCTHSGKKDEPFTWMTATPALLAKSEFAVIVFSGKWQMNALCSLTKDDQPLSALPCSIVKEIPSCIVATDIKCQATDELM